MMRCIIVDDEPLAIEILETYLDRIKDSELVAKFTDSLEAFTFIQQHSVDIVFLDLNMPVLNGLDLLKNLKTKPHIIITTAYRDFAVESFELDVLDYLVKPIAFPRFLKAVNKVIPSAQPKPEQTVVKTEKNDTANTLWIKVDKKIVPVQPFEILYIQSLKDYVRIVTEDQKLITYSTLQSLLNKLSEGEFLRIHKSYIVQVNKVKSIEGNMIHIKNETLPIGRNYRKDLLKIIEY
jgi:two-component system, LytTR family, response regulator